MEDSREYQERYYQKNKEKLRKQNKKWREKNKDKIAKDRKDNIIEIREYKRKWRKDNPEKVKKQQDGWRKKNLDKAREYSRKYKKNHPEKMKEIRRAYRERHPLMRRYKLRFEILKRDNFTCQYCGRNVIEDGIKLQIDHIHPKSKGGINSRMNLITACSDCNIGKFDVLLSE